MTPVPTKQAFDQLQVIDLKPGDIHILPFKEMAMDGIGVRDILSDFAFGSLLWVTVGDTDLKLCTKSEAAVFQAQFVKPDRERYVRKGPAYMIKRFGAPFLGPDGKVVQIEGLTLHGGKKDLEVSPLTPEEIKSHANYNQWVHATFYCNMGSEHPAISAKYPDHLQNHLTRRLQPGDYNLYMRENGWKTKDQVDAAVNAPDHSYECSPFSRPQTAEEKHEPGGKNKAAIDIDDDDEVQPTIHSAKTSASKRIHADTDTDADADTEAPPAKRPKQYNSYDDEVKAYKEMSEGELFALRSQLSRSIKAIDEAMLSKRRIGGTSLA